MEGLRIEAYQIGTAIKPAEKVYMRWVRVVPGKHGMAALMLEIKETKKNAEAILVHMHQGYT